MTVQCSRSERAGRGLNRFMRYRLDDTVKQNRSLHYLSTVHRDFQDDDEALQDAKWLLSLWTASRELSFDELA